MNTSKNWMKVGGELRCPVHVNMVLRVDVRWGSRLVLLLSLRHGNVLLCLYSKNNTPFLVFLTLNGFLDRSPKDSLVMDWTGKYKYCNQLLETYNSESDTEKLGSM